jgi:hypothetical protein
LSMLAHQEEVIPIPSGDSMVHYGTRRWILVTSLICSSILEQKTALQFCVRECDMVHSCKLGQYKYHWDVGATKAVCLLGTYAAMTSAAVHQLHVCAGNFLSVSKQFSTTWNISSQWDVWDKPTAQQKHCLFLQWHNSNISEEHWEPLLCRPPTSQYVWVITDISVCCVHSFQIFAVAVSFSLENAQRNNLNRIKIINIFPSRSSTALMKLQFSLCATYWVANGSCSCSYINSTNTAAVNQLTAEWQVWKSISQLHAHTDLQ